jgi:hypothetical protein
MSVLVLPGERQMSMTAAQQATWHEIVEAYIEWNAGDNGLMPVSELRESVSASQIRVGPQMCGPFFTLLVLVPHSLAGIFELG